MQLLSLGTAARLLVVVWAAALCASAQEVREVAESSGLSASVAPPHSRDLNGKFRLAREQLELRAFAPITATITELLSFESDAAQFVLLSSANRAPAHEHWIGTTAAARLLLKQLPNDEQTRWLERLNRVAANELAQAVAASDVAALRRVAARFPLTESSREALRYLAARSFDLGELAAADAALRRALESGIFNDRDRRRSTQLRQLAVAVNPHVPPSALTSNRNWHATGGISTETVAALNESLQEQGEQSIVFAPRAKPLARGNLLVTRMLNRLMAIDSTTGREVWTDSATANGLDPSAPLAGNLSLKELVARSLGRQLQMDSVLPSLASDGEFVASVDPLDSTTVLMPNVLNRQESIRSNVLRLRRLQSGEVVWMSRGEDWWQRPDAARQAEVVLPELGIEPRFDGSVSSRSRGDVFFLGAPKFVDRSAWGIAQVGTVLVGYELLLADGRCLWSTTIAEAPRRQAADADWKSVAARVEVFAGHIVFLTSSGLISAFDLATREPMWCWRSERSDAPPHWRQFGSEGIGHRPWWNGWRETISVVSSVEHNGQQQDILVTAGPDRAEVLAFDFAGNVLWRAPRRVGCDLIGLARGKVLLIERHVASVLDAATGKTEWSVPIPTPTGEGFLLDGPHRLNNVPSQFNSLAATATGTAMKSAEQTPWGVYVIPSGTEFAILDLNQRTIERISAPSGVLLGNCIATEHGIVSLSIDGLRLLPSLDVLRADAKPSRNDDHSIPVAMRRLIRDAEEFSRSKHFRRDVSPLSNARSAFELLTHNPPGLQLFDDWGPLRRVRFDRLLGAYLGELSEHDVAARDWIAEQLAAERLKASASPDPFAMQRYAQRFEHFDAAQFQAIAPAARIGLSHLQSQLLLLSRVRPSDLKLSEQALKSLAEHYRSRSYDDDIRATLLKAYWQASVAAHQQPSLGHPFETDADWQTLVSQFGKRVKSHWSSTTPSVTEHELARNEIAFLSVPVEAAQGSLLNRLDVGFHWYSGNIVRFVGDGRPGDWTINLPTTRSNFRRMPPLVRGWGIGHLLILRAGTELFAIAPLDESGEPKARLVWHADTRPDAQLEGQRLKPARLGLSDIDVQFLDAYDRPLGQVGPVCAGYLCYQSSGKLVCLDTATGLKFWERFELPDESIVTGDEEHIFLTDEQSGYTSVLRVIDGREVRRFDVASDRTIEVAPKRTVQRDSRFIHQVGNWLVRMRSTTLEVIDLRSGHLVWSRQLTDQNTLPFAVDEHSLGLFEAQAAIWLDLATGRERFRTAIARPDKTEVLFCSGDGDSYYLCASGPRRPEAAQMLLHPRWHRNPLITGVLIAIDRHDGLEHWRLNLTDTNVPLDPPKSVPFLTLTSVNWPKDVATPATSSALSLVDKRTGQTFVRTNDPGDGMHLIRPNSQQRTVSVRTRTKELRLEFPLPK